MQYDERNGKRAVAANIAAVAAARVTAKKKIIVLQRRNKKKTQTAYRQEQTETQVTFINERRAVSADGKLSEKEEERKKRLEAKQIAADKRLMAKGLSGCSPPRDGTFDVKFTCKATGHILLRIGVDLMKLMMIREVDLPEARRFSRSWPHCQGKIYCGRQKSEEFDWRFLPAQIIKVNVDKVDPDAFGPKAVEQRCKT